MPKALLVFVAAFALGCGKAQVPQPATSQAEPAAASQKPQEFAMPKAPTINPDRAWKYVKDIVAFGRRAVGTPGHSREEAYIKEALKGDQVEDDVFTADTPAGKFTMRNIIAKYPGTTDGIIVVASHYDTAYPIADFVGANDGGSSTGLLLELANELRGKKLSGPSVWLVFFDGEEAFKDWSSTDSIYGSRHLAEKWQQDGISKRIKAFLLADMIGDRDLNIDHDANSDPRLENIVYQAAQHLALQSYFYGRNVEIEDDHIPFAKTGVPVADLIDLDYGYNNVFWHTPQDTMDKLSPKSLEIVGNVILQTIAALSVNPAGK